ncbi:deoxynucleotidyltransferase terminal-interacting protein 2 [Microplitis demolitor]|uniref:deoxynucleotidyltransferase terminal-interacting protein 2 n=1 Tax=Microplitis demolitor TaxID=69319 RepID=UPI0004CD2959|nr:deoxynucleotidyltransferase terminal-interacting protein 2 [Microplitis demolitor]
MNFIIDTQGEENNLSKSQFIDSDDELDFDNFSFEIPEDVEKPKKLKNSREIDIEELDSFMGWNESSKNSKVRGKIQNKELKVPVADKTSEDPVEKEIKECLKKAVVGPGFEQLETVPRYEISRRRQAIERKREREKTKGSKWFNMPATEMTPEIRHDLQVIQMRSVLDPKHFYKKNDIKALPKYFQIGKVVDSPVEFYSGRLSNKERKRTLVDELMADAEFAKYNKKKYKEIIKEQGVGLKKAHARAKRLKKKK